MNSSTPPHTTLYCMYIVYAHVHYAMPREKKVNKRRKKTRGPGWSIYLLVDGRVGREHADSIIVPYGIVPA